MVNTSKYGEGGGIEDCQDDKDQNGECQGDNKEGDPPFKPFIAFEQFTAR